MNLVEALYKVIFFREMFQTINLNIFTKFEKFFNLNLMCHFLEENLTQLVHG